METTTNRKVIALIVACLCTVACQKTASGPARPAGAPIHVKAPLGLPPLDVPPDNPVTAETVALGRKLFYETKLSGDNTVSCATCHNPAMGFSDGSRVSTGMNGKKGTRNAPTVLNAAYASLQFWDGRARNLEEQAAVPIGNPVEMNQKHDVCASKLDDDPAYVAEFTKAFGPGPVTMEKIQKAIAAFERTMLSGNSPFDRFIYGGDKEALSPAAIRGYAIFGDTNRGNCANCHSLGERDSLFTDGKFHNLGVGVNSDGDLVDPGRFTATKAEADKGRFRTPTLRNIAKTAPYMHDGSFRTLRQVVDFYVGGGNSNPWLDKDMKPLTLTRQERDDLVAFLESLTGDMPPDAGPPTAGK